MTIPFYDEHGQSFFDRTINANLNNLYDAFEKYLPENAHIFEVGCGSGRDAKAFIERGYRVTASDGSATMVKLAQEYLGQDVLHLTFDEIDFDNEFDALWANACLLHLTRDEMPTVFQRLSCMPASKRGKMRKSATMGVSSHSLMKLPCVILLPNLTRSKSLK
jgi:SAM-dependent methyltransferase